MISGGSDPVGENGRGVIRAYTAFLNAGLENVQLKLYPGARHELLNETNKQQVYDDTLFWINGLC
jgi:alpha-beta hydrolase superfamily lysophospholipase